MSRTVTCRACGRELQGSIEAACFTVGRRVIFIWSETQDCNWSRCRVCKKILCKRCFKGLKQICSDECSFRDLVENAGDTKEPGGSPSDDAAGSVAAQGFNVSRSS